MKRNELLQWLNNFMRPDDIRDYCPNGLQVEGRQDIQKIVSGVTACEALIDAAIDVGADAILVHHGYFWKGENPVVKGMKRTRLEKLLRHQINLLAYHLPLDVHPDVGNNVTLARRLGFEALSAVEADGIPDLLWRGKLPREMSVEQLSQHLSASLEHEPVVVKGGEHLITTLAWCTGGAQSFIDDAAALGVDAYISGEISEQTTHSAREQGVHYFAAGHHATERYGVQALGEKLAESTGISCQYVDISNPA